ncbi:hypothetical protein L7F22_003056 [Adiantum nelumboides]|nr:hypothetical protein [Adiantum nelumboides]
MSPPPLNARASLSSERSAGKSQLPSSQGNTIGIGSSSVKPKRRSDQNRPGTASTVSSYMSAKPFLEDSSSPTRRAFGIPPIDSISNSSHGSEFAYEDLLANNGDTLLVTSGMNRQNSLTKRDILNSANSAYGSSSGSHRDDDSLSATSSRRTLMAIENENVSSDGHSNVSEDRSLGKRRSSINARSHRRSSSRSRIISSTNKGRPSSSSSSIVNGNMGTNPRSSNTEAEGRASNSTRGSNHFITPPSGGASPASPTSSLPVHPHHRTNKSRTEKMPFFTSNRNQNTSESSSETQKQSKNEEDNEKTPKPQSTPKFADSPSFGDKTGRSPMLGSPILDSSLTGDKSTSALRERIKKTGGFLRRLGGGGNNSTNSDNTTSPKTSLLTPRKQILRKGSHNSLVSEGGLGVGGSSNIRATTAGAASTDDLPTWSVKTDVPVPSIPEQYRDQMTPSMSKSSQNTIQASRQKGQKDGYVMTSGLPASPNQTKNAKKTNAQLKPSVSGEYFNAIKAWEKEMDAALEKSGQNLEEKTKIEAPRSNWTPSPQLPEYRVLNRKGSFMDEGNEESNARSTNNSGTLNESATKAFGISVHPSKDSQTSNGISTVSYDSHFLQPVMNRSARTSNPNPASVNQELNTVQANIAPSTEPIRSTSRFVDQPMSDDTDSSEIYMHPSRDDNISAITTKSYETAIDRPSLFLRHAQQEENGRDSFPKDTNGNTNTEAIASSPSGLPENSIRLVTANNDVIDQSDKVSDSAHPDDVQKAKELADKCWNEDETFKKREKIAEWLGGVGITNKRACTFYIAKFDFTRLSVDGALRKLCDKLFLRAETQQVDRILSTFSNRYFECNPNTLFGSADIVHAVTFSILLLNTDLHVAELSERMTRQQFIRNTVDAILETSTNGNAEEKNKVGTAEVIGSRAWEEKMELVLRDLYNGVKSDRIRLPLPVSDGSSTRRTVRLAGSERVNALKRGSIRGIQGLMGSNNSVIRNSEEMMRFNNALSPSRQSTASDSQPRPSISSLAPPSPSILHSSPSNTPTMGFANTLSKSIIRESNDEAETLSIDSEKDDFTDEELALMGPPWAKEGMLTRKQYWEAPHKRAKDKSWVDCFTVIQKGQLSMFRFGANSSSGTVKQRDPTVGGGNWLSNATCIGEFSLAHSLANILPPPGYNRSRPHVFALTLPSGSVYFFQTAHEELAQEWMSTCNYWAARLSKEPLAAGVSNMEYGWNRLQSFSQGELDPNVRIDELTIANSARSIAETMSVGGGESTTNERDETEEVTNSSPEGSILPSPTSGHSHAFLNGPNTKASNAHGGTDARSVRSGRSGRSLRLRTNALFQGRSQGNSLDQIVIASSSNQNAYGHQSGFSSPVASMTSLSTPNTSVSTLERPTMVYDWQAPIPPMMPSTLSEEDQLEACIRQTAKIEQDLTLHNSLRQPMLNMFRTANSNSGNRYGQSFNLRSTYSLSPNSTMAGASSISLSATSSTSPDGSIGSGLGNDLVNSPPHPSTQASVLANKALANWEKRSAYLLSELTKFQLYVDSLKGANQLRSDKRSERELNRMMQQADEGLRKVGNDVKNATITASRNTIKE